MLSGILIGLINILTGFFVIQLNQSISYIDIVYVLGINIKIEIILYIMIIIPIILNIIYIAVKREKTQSIVCAIEIILIILSIVVVSKVLNSRIQDIWSIITAIWIIVIAIVHITINMKDYKENNIGINIIFCILSVILAMSIYILVISQVKYNEYVRNKKDENIADYKKLYLVNKDKYGYIDENGNEIIPCIYDEIIYPYGNTNLVVLRKENEINIINTKGEILLEVDKKCNINFIKKLAKDMSTNINANNVSYKENRYKVLEQIDENLYEYNDKYNLYYNCYYDEEQDKQICDCKLIDRYSGVDFLVIETNSLPSDGNKIYIYQNYNIPFANDSQKGFYTPDGAKYLINADDMYVEHFDGSNILFKNNEYFIFNNLQETYTNIWILDNIYIVKLEDEKYKILDKNLNTIMENLADIKICEDIIKYSKNKETYGLMSEVGEILTEDKYDTIEEPEIYENKFTDKIKIMYEK